MAQCVVLIEARAYHGIVVFFFVVIWQIGLARRVNLFLLRLRLGVDVRLTSSLATCSARLSYERPLKPC